MVNRAKNQKRNRGELMKKLLALMLLVGLVQAQSLALVVQKTGDSITIKDMYTVDADAKEYGSEGYHYVELGDSKYPIDLRGIVFSEPEGLKKDGSQAYAPKPQDIYYEEDFEEVILVPMQDVPQVKITDSNGTVLATAQVDDAVSLEDEYYEEAEPQKLQADYGFVKNTGQKSLVTFFLNILAPLFEVIGL